jgi:GTP-binding protein
LGSDFLKHIQRTKVLIHVLDGSAEDPIADFTQTNSEMALFDPILAQKPQLVVVNKMDLPEVQEKWPEIRKTLNKLGHDAVLISALTRENLQPVLWKAKELLATRLKVELLAESPPVYTLESDPRDFKITRETGGWRVKGTAIERAAEMTYWEHDGSVRRFQRLMEKLGVEEALRREGIEEGDTVFILDYELEWQD